MLKRWLLHPSDTTSLGKAASDANIDIKLSNIKPIHASWIVAAFQQVTKETLIRGWEKTCIKECVDNCRL